MIARALIALFALLVATPARAQIVVTVPGSADVPLAVPDAQLPQGAVPGAGEFAETLRQDLAMSGYFQLISPNAYLEQGKGVEPGSFGFEDWRILKTSVLVKTRMLPPAACSGKVCADVYVYNVGSGDQVLARRFRADNGQERHQAHAVANAVLLAVTGRPGIFGSRLLAVGTASGNKEVYLLDLDGKGVAPVTANGSVNLSPTFSPDARKIAWTSYKKGQPDLYVKDLTSGRVKLVSNRKGVNISPAYSPDGATLAMARNAASGDSDLFLIDAQTGADLQRLTTGGGIDVSPNFSPDGKRIAFASERSGGSQIYVLELATGQATRVSYEGGFNTDPVFSPDGSQIAFVGRVAGGFDIYVVGADGKGLQQVTSGAGDNEDPAWSPDGHYLVFSSTRTGRSELWLSTADGRHQSRITQGGGWFQPMFAPGVR
jgi:TolB protein